MGNSESLITVIPTPSIKEIRLLNDDGDHEFVLKSGQRHKMDRSRIKCVEIGHDGTIRKLTAIEGFK